MVWCSVTSQLAAGIVIIFGRSGRVKPGQAAFDFPLQLVLFRIHTNIDATKCIFAACLHISLPIYALTCILAGTHTAAYALPLTLPPPPSPSLSLLALGLQIIFWHSIRHLFSGVRSRHRMLHAKFSCSCCCCCSKQTEKVATMFQIIYFGIADYVAYLWDFSLCVCANFSRRTVNLNGKTWCSL